MESAGLLRSRVRRRIVWLAAAAAGLSLVLAATALAAPDRAAAILGRPQRGIAAALAQEARQVLERTHPPSAPGEGHNHSEEWHNAFAEVAIALVMTGQPDAARRLIEDAGEHGDQIIPLSAQVAAALVLAGRVAEANQAIAESGTKIATDHFIKIGGWLVADGRPADAVRLSRTLLVGEDLDKALAAITRALAEKGQIASARRLAATIKDPGQQALAFSALVSVAAAQRQTKDAERFLAIALEQARLADDPTAAQIPLATALASVRGANEVIDLVSRIAELHQRNAALAAAFNRFTQLGKTADAEALERHAIKLIAEAWPKEDSSYCASVGDSTPYRHARAGRTAAAIAAAATISEPWIRTETFACLSVLFADSGRARDARLAVRQAIAVAEAIIPSEAPVEATIDEGPGCHDGPVSYDFLLDAIVKAQDIDEVRRIAATFPNGSHRGFMLALAAAALWRTGETRQAEQAADAGWTAYRDGPHRSDLAEEAMVWMLAKVGMARKAGEIAQAAGRMDLGPYLASRLRFAGRFRDAYDFEHYAGAHDKPPAPEPAIFALLRTGQLDRAVSYARQFDDSPLRAKVLARAAIRYMRAVPIHTPD